MKYFRYLLIFCLATPLLQVYAQVAVPALVFQTFLGGPSLVNVAQTSGTNRWVVNNVYTGSGGNPTVPSQLLATGGSISEPNGNYLHITNTTFASQNAAYSTTTASESTARLVRSFCTLNLVNVRLTLFWLADGGASLNNYGEVLYSTDGGASWQVATSEGGLDKLRGQANWKFESYKVPAFENKQDLRFAFRWRNDAAGGPANLGFAIDDVALTAEYSPTNPDLDPANLTVTFSPSSVCVTAGVTLNMVSVASKVPLCDGTLTLEMSDENGNFPDPPQNIVMGIPSGDFSSTGSGSYPIFDVPVPVGSITPPATRRIRAVYDNGYRIKGLPSASTLTIESCPRTITTLMPAVALEDSACIGSVIDVPFVSTGFYNAANDYVIQLSDANGSFANPLVLGKRRDNTTYPGPPGEVSGQILADAKIPALDTLLPGCGYRVRVVSTGPTVSPSGLTPSPPFCLKVCPLETNDLKDFRACIDVNNPSSHAVSYIDTTGKSFPAGSVVRFKLYRKADQNADKLLDPVNPGITATKNTTVPDGTLAFNLPKGEDLATLFGFQLDETFYNFYGRLEVVHPSYPGGVYRGTVVRFTLNTIPQVPLPTDMTGDGYLCPSSGTSQDFEVDFSKTPYEFGRKYQWYFGGTTQANIIRGLEEPFIGFGDATGLTPGTYPVYVRAISSDPSCVGPLTKAGDVVVRGMASALTGYNVPDKVCFESEFLVRLQGPYGGNLGPGSVTNWEVTNGQIVAQDNISARIRFLSVGTATIKSTSFSGCGAPKTLTKTVQVVDGPTPIQNPGNQTLCTGQAKTLTVNSNGNIVWKRGTQVMGTGPSYTFLSATPGFSQWSVESTLPGLTDCVRLERFNVLYNQAPTASYVADVNMDDFQAFTGPTVIRCTNTSKDYETYRWLVNGQSMGSTPTLTVSIPKEGRYTISLEATGFSGCKDVYTRQVEYSSEIRVRFPTAFSPNNDNLNDVFGPVTDNLKEGKLYVWNRWGELVFDASGGPAALLWDGTKEGTPVPEGVYVYKFILTDIRGEQKEMNGTVTLVH